MTLEENIRRIAREEVASAFGLILNRLAELGARPDDLADLVEALKSIAGEGLRDFSSATNEPGEKR